MGNRHYHGHIDKRGNADLAKAYSYESRPGSPFVKLDVELSLDAQKYTVWRQWENDGYKTWDYPMTIDGLKAARRRFELEYARAERKFKMTLSRSIVELEMRRLEWLKEKGAEKKSIKRLPPMAKKKAKLKELLREMRLEEKELLNIFRESQQERHASE